MQIKQGSTVKATKSYTAAQLVSAASWSAGQYHHGYINFEFADYVNLKRNTTYRINLTSSGYTFAATAYLGWIRPHENVYNNSTELTNEFSNSFGYQLWGINMSRVLDFVDGFSSASSPATVAPTPYTVYADEAIANGGTISSSAEGAQLRPIHGSGGAVTAANAPFGTVTTNWFNGMIIALEGTGNGVTLVQVNTAGGLIHNADKTLTQGSTVAYRYNSTLNRWIEIEGNNL